MGKYATDRIAGLILLAIAVWYSVEATTFEVSMVGDPLGPTAFPLLVGVLLGLFSILMIVRPDPNPTWPPRAAWIKMGMIIGSFVAYAFLIRPLGFILSTTLEMFALALIFDGPPLKAFIASLLFSIFLYMLFSFALDLGLPQGIITFI